MRFVPFLGLCVGCVVTGQQYGGGDGLTLTLPTGSYTFPGATASEMRSEAPGVASVYVPDDTADPWLIRATGDAFTTSDALEALGLPCPELATSYEIVASLYRVEVHYADGIGASNAYGEGGEITGGATEGAAQQTLAWAEMIDGCTADLPAEVEATWSFDPDVAVTVRGAPTFEIPGDPQFER